MRRFTDPLLFGILFLVTTIVWWVSAVTHNITDTPSNQLAPMTVVVFCIIATPAFALATLLALFRAVFNVKPKPFWTWVTGASALAAVLVYLAKAITDVQGVQVGFSTTTWFAAALTMSALIGLVLAVTGALPWYSPEERAQRAKERAKQKAEDKAERKAERKAEKQEQARQRKEQKAEAAAAAAPPVLGAQDTASDAPPSPNSYATAAATQIEDVAAPIVDGRPDDREGEGTTAGS